MMSRSENIPQPVPEKFRPLTEVKRGHFTSHLPRKFAEMNAELAKSPRVTKAKEGI